MAAIALITQLAPCPPMGRSELFGDLIRPEVVASGQLGGSEHPGVVVLRARRGWDTIRGEIGISDEDNAQLGRLHGPLGGMDWSRDMLVVVSGGQQVTGGFEVVVLRVTTMPNDRGWKLVARLTTPAEGEMSTQMITSPWSVVRLRRITGNPSFFIERKARKVPAR